MEKLRIELEREKAYNKKLGAIKIIKEYFVISLKEAKELVDKHWDKQLAVLDMITVLTQNYKLVPVMQEVKDKADAHMTDFKAVANRALDFLRDLRPDGDYEEIESLDATIKELETKLNNM